MVARERLRLARIATLAALFGAGLASQALAQAPAQVRPGANPADAAAPVPAVVPPSSFAGYRPHSEAKVAPWREVNDEVGRIGGWKAYAREAYEAAQAAAAAEKSAPPAMHRHGAKPPN